MPVPAVSPYNWERTKLICHFVMGPPMSLVHELSFQEKLETILDSMDGETTESTRENEETNNDENSGFIYDPRFEDKIDPEDPYVAGGDARDRHDDHRPRVDEEIVEELQRTLKDEKPKVPAEKLDFDSTLSVLLDLQERYYESKQCEMTILA